MRPSCRPTSHDGAAVAGMGFLALAIAGAVMLAALPELLFIARAVASPAVFAPF